LAALAKEAAMIALRRYLPNIKEIGEEPLSKEFLEKMRVTKEDFEKALLRVEPSGMREVMVEIPKVRWEDIGGLEDVKQALREAVEWPLKYPKLFEEAGIEPPKGILLFGPPGTGKTLLAKAVATESGANFIPVRGPEILSKNIQSKYLTSPMKLIEYMATNIPIVTINYPTIKELLCSEYLYKTDNDPKEFAKTILKAANENINYKERLKCVEKLSYKNRSKEFHKNLQKIFK
jgi:hypothetical protein